MAKVCNPTLFSKYFGFSPALLTSAGLIDPLVDVDTQLFIDPILLEKSDNQVIAQEALVAYRLHFQNLVRLLKISKAEGDVAWKAAQRQLDLSEPAENGLGYGGSGRSGSSRPEELRDIILRTCKEIITLGAEDPEMISLMGLFEENVGADTISDLTTRVIIEQLAKITNSFCVQNSVPVGDNKVSSLSLPIYTDRRGQKRAIVLIPSDIVRDLPIANDWSDVQDAASQNAELRNRINRYLAGIIRPTVTDKKDALRKTALSSADLFGLFLATIKENTETTIQTRMRLDITN